MIIQIRLFYATTTTLCTGFPLDPYFSMRHPSALYYLSILLTRLFVLGSVLENKEQLLITSPPAPQATSCSSPQILKRQETCQFGQCGTSCLSQGAFCCGPAGTLATSPFWVCDDGSCVTSVRGNTGDVDCYDPDNPSGTTQSCIDNVPTATCDPTDRCYTCSTDQPFCRWETYIAANSPTLRWFSCVESKVPDATFLVATISPSSGHSTISPTSLAMAQGSNSNADNEAILSTGAIIGITVAGSTTVLGIVGIIAYCCFKKRELKSPRPQELHSETIQGPTTAPVAVELDSHAYTRSELSGTAVYSPDSQPRTPFSAPGTYPRNTDDIDIWSPGSGIARVDSHGPPAYTVQSPSELCGDQRSQRDSWSQGDDKAYLSPTRQH